MREIYETREEYEMAMRSGIGNNYILPMESNEEVKVLQEKLDIAVKALDDAGTYLTCMDDLSEVNNGKCNEQMALEIINEALAKIKEKNNVIFRRTSARVQKRG